MNLVLGDLRVIDTEAGAVGDQAVAHVDGRSLTSVSSILRASMHRPPILVVWSQVSPGALFGGTCAV